MFTPVRALYSFRLSASSGILASAAAVAALFNATPFILPGIADHYGIRLGTAGILSTVQVGTFALASFVGGRRVVPSIALTRGSVAAFVAANLASTLTFSFGVLLVLRGVVGVAAGILVWLAWADAMSHPRGLGDISSVGPVTALVAAPVMGWVAGASGFHAVFFVLALIAVPALVLPVRLGIPVRQVRTPSGSRSNRLLVVAMGILTLSGSSLFVFAAAAAKLSGLSLVAASAAFSLNALAGIVATRLRSKRAGLWLLGTAVSAAVVGLVHVAFWFYAAMAVWGFTFWMGVPEVFRLLARRSLVPDERVGDTQAVMAAGRALGPLAGGLLLGNGSFSSLGIAAPSGLALSAGMIGTVEVWRRHHPSGGPDAA